MCEKHQSKQPVVCELAKLDLCTFDEHSFTNTFTFWQGFPHNQLLLILHDCICILYTNTETHTYTQSKFKHNQRCTETGGLTLSLTHTHTCTNTQIPPPTNSTNRKRAVMISSD